MNLKGAENFAKEQGYKGVVFLKKWRGYDCYEPYMSKGEVSYTGLPFVVMEKNGKFRMSTADEAMEI